MLSRKDERWCNVHPLFSVQLAIWLELFFEFLPYGKKSIEVLDIVPIKQCS